MKNRILKYLILLLIITLIFLTYKILIIADSENFFNPYEIVDNQLVVSLILVLISLFLSLYYLYKKDEKEVPFGEKFVFSEKKIDRSNMPKKPFAQDVLPLKKNKVTNYKILKIICTLMVFFYIVSFIFFYKYSSLDYLLKSFFILSICLSIITSIGIFLGKRWSWSLALFFSLVQFLWFPIGTISGFVLCILCICTFPEKIKFRWNDYRLKQKKFKKINRRENAEYINQMARGKNDQFR